MRAHKIGFDTLTESLDNSTLARNRGAAPSTEAKLIAKEIDRDGISTYVNDDVWWRSESRLYKPGDKVFPHGNGWGAVGNWDKPYYFITSIRSNGGGGYLVMRPNGTTTMLTNLRKTKDETRPGAKTKGFVAPMPNNTY